MPIYEQVVIVITYPMHRYRRLRSSKFMREMVRETSLQPADLIYPIFVTEEEGTKAPVQSMPGIFRLPLDQVVAEAQRAYNAGIPAVLLFGIPLSKDEKGSSAYDPQGVVQRAVSTLKENFPELLVITDVCLCEYTSHGHCGVVEDGGVANDPTLELLAQVAVSHARAGADVVAPSDMMDGRVQAIRRSLDDEGFTDVSILSYAAKYASAFYGPFREAAGSAPGFGDRRTYQMDPANSREALKEVKADLDEGADMVMVKPALAYLDVISRIRSEVEVPLVAYNVSGEYSMVKKAAQEGLVDEKNTVMEILTAIKRAGADIIITYHALQVAEWLQQEK